MSTTPAAQLLHASFKGDTAIVRHLLADDPALADMPGSDAWENGTPLTLAALGGHIDIAHLLLDLGAAVNHLSNDGSALLLAAWGGHEPMVRLLINSGGDVNLATDSGETPLLAAAFQGFAPVAAVLLDHGARVNSQTTQGTTEFFNTSPPVCGETALHLAAAEGHREMIELLLSRGADKTLTDHTGQRALHWAARHHHDELIPLLKGSPDPSQP